MGLVDSFLTLKKQTNKQCWILLSFQFVSFCILRQIQNNMEKYETIKALGEGTFGSVTKARNKNTNEIVAIKRMKA